MFYLALKYELGIWLSLKGHSNLASVYRSHWLRPEDYLICPVSSVCDVSLEVVGTLGLECFRQDRRGGGVG